MPILDIDLVLKPGETLATDLAQRMADAAGTALDAAPGRTWVKLDPMEPERYAESGGAEFAPVFARLLLGNPPEGEARAAMIERLTRALADVRGCDAQHVHILIEPAAAGRIAFGGRLAG